MTEPPQRAGKTMIVIGTDEAGYGPNLGPLVVSACSWETGSEDFSGLQSDLARLGLRVDDSKKLYRGADTLAALEIGTLVFLRLLRAPSLLEPLAVAETEPDDLAPKVDRLLLEKKVKLRSLLHRSVPPDEFNRLLDRSSSKGTLLSEVTLELVRKTLDSLSPETDVLILCDKHGGRNRYLDLLNRFFPGEMIWVVRESRQASAYRFDFGACRIEIRFIAKGDSLFPVAVSSMCSKYFRERAMREFNAFWQEKIPGLKPTAGYPEDARRFKKEITAMQKELGIPDEELWRNL